MARIRADEIDVSRIRVCTEQAYTKLERMRTKRREMIQQYVGYNYGEDGAEDKVPKNLIELYVATHVGTLVPKNPRVLISARARELRPVADSFSKVVNKKLEDMRFDRTVARAVMDSLFAIGVVWIGMAIDDDDVLSDTNELYCCSIDPDDFFFDTTAHTWEECQFIGHRYTVPLAAARAFTPFIRSARRKLKANPWGALNPDGSSRSSSISVGEDQQDTLVDMVTLIDVWMPGDDIIVTLPAEDLAGVLRIIDWEGPRLGPYHTLSFEHVPGNILPLPPLANLYDLHTACNQLYAKTFRQAERQKTLTVTMQGDETDRLKLQDASDGDTVPMLGPQPPQEVRYGGADQSNVVFQEHIREAFSYFSGGLDIIAGLAPQSQTATQDQLLSASASRRITDKQATVIDFVRRITRDLAWYRWQDRAKTDYVVKKAGQFEVTEEFGPERPGEWNDFDFQIDPYSMQTHTPAQRLQLMQQLLQLTSPMLGMAQASEGLTLSVKKIVDLFADYTDWPEAREIIAPASPVQAGAEQMTSGKPNTSRRVYERVNRPSGQRNANAASLGEMLAAANSRRG